MRPEHARPARYGPGQDAPPGRARSTRSLLSRSEPAVRRGRLFSGVVATLRERPARPLGVAGVGLSVALALMLAGCGGGGGGPDLTQGLKPEQILTQSIARARNLSSYNLSMDIAGSGTTNPGAPAPTGLAALLTGGLSLSGAGPLRPPDGSLDLAVKTGPLPVQLNLTKAAGGLYVSLAGSTVQVTVPADAMGALNLDSIRTAPLTWMTDPTLVGRETIDGVSTVHLTGRLNAVRVGGDLLAALNALGALGLGQPLTPTMATKSEQRLGASLRAVELGIWIGTRDLQPRRVVAKLRLKGQVDALKGVTSAAIDLRTDVTNLNSAPAITPPPTSRTVTPSDLPSLFGG